METTIDFEEIERSFRQPLNMVAELIYKNSMSGSSNSEFAYIPIRNVLSDKTIGSGSLFDDVCGLKFYDTVTGDVFLVVMKKTYTTRQLIDILKRVRIREDY